MALVNHRAREVHFKIVYYGPGLGGKTTNLRSLHDRLPPERRGQLISIATEHERTLFFDFLPIELGKVNGLTTRFHLYTVPGQVYYRLSRRAVLQGLDAVVFVADSHPAREAANHESLADLGTQIVTLGSRPTTSADAVGVPVQQARSAAGHADRADARGPQCFGSARVRGDRGARRGRERDAARGVQGSARAARRTDAGGRRRRTGWLRRRKSRRSAGVKAFARALATLGPVGYAPIAPATVASLVVALVGWFLPAPPLLVALCLIAAGTALAVWLCGVAEESLGRDAHPIVADEVVGQSLALVLVPHQPLAFLASFVLFRIFDVWKPLGANQAQALPGGLGVVADDVIAGLTACAAFHLGWLGLRSMGAMH
jgi:phosphatidylglycerophosphatase A